MELQGNPTLRIRKKTIHRIHQTQQNNENQNKVVCSLSYDIITEPIYQTLPRKICLKKLKKKVKIRGYSGEIAGKLPTRNSFPPAQKGNNGKCCNVSLT